MDGAASSSPDWDHLFEIAAAQDGLFTTRQAAAAGYSPQLIAHHLSAGRMVRVRRGVYRIVHFPAGDHEDLTAVWLWSEQEGVFSHQTALALHDLSDVLPAQVHHASRALAPAAAPRARRRAPALRHRRRERPAHILVEEPLSWEDSPPSSGPHRARWARWGAYTYLSPARWLHNLEHGGVAILYDPCMPPCDVATLRAWANAFPDDDMGPFRWVLTPGLQTPVALVAWEEVLLLPCWRPSDVEAFVTTHYRTAPEDFPFEGGYDRGWLGR